MLPECKLHKNIVGAVLNVSVKSLDTRINVNNGYGYMCHNCEMVYKWMRVIYDT